MKLTMALILMCLSFNTFGRQPAVDPFVGVEPSGYVDRAPSSEKPYNFEQNQKAVMKTQNPSTATAPVLAKEDPAKSDFMLPYFFFLAALISLPFAIWNITIGNLSKKTEENVVVFPSHKKDDDDDWKKKAS